MRVRQPRAAFLPGRVDTPIVTGDEPGDGVCIVLDGSVKVFVETSDGNRVVLAILTAGELVGEMSTVDRLGLLGDRGHP